MGKRSKAGKESAKARMRSLFRILGPLEVEGGGPLGGPQQRALLRRLLLSPNTVVTIDRLVDAVWGETPPARVREALQVYVSHLRKAIPDGATRIRFVQGGYRIAVEEDELDALRFERLVDQGRVLLASGETAEAAGVLEEALDLWRGPLEGDAAGDPEVARLEELRLAAFEDRIEAELELGRHRELVPELEALVAQEPLREGLRRQLMLALYRSGRQADALAAYQDARRALVEELGLEPSAGLRELEAAILRHDPALTVEPAEVRARRRLPAPATALIGRRREVDEVGELLGGEARLVTLTGPGGTGKTRVAIQAAYELAERFADGAAFVGLAALRDPELVLPEIATALDVSNGHDPRAALADHLRERNELLVIDNFEQVDEAAPALTSLLGEAPGLKLLVTSRRPLRVYGEHEFPVAPLALDEAVPLFLDRARAAGRPLQGSEDIREICRHLDCLPLAIELVAARARELTPAEMRSMLDTRLELASRGARDLPARQQTLRATIEWSYALLDERERRVFAALSVFAGGCTRDAAAVVCDGDPETLSSLVEKSLLVRQDGRFALLETVREYALERLVHEHDETVVRRRHAEYYVELGLEAKPQLKGAEAGDWLQRLESEHDNLRAALEWAHDNDPNAFVRLVDALYLFWYLRGHFREGLRWYDRARAVAGADPQARADVLKLGAAFAYQCQEFSLARSLIGEALSFYRKAADTTNSARALTLLGLIATNEGRPEEGLPVLEEAIALARDTQDEGVIAFALTNFGYVALAAGNVERAYAVSLEALELLRARPPERALASEVGTVLGNLGLAALLRDRLDEARGYLAESLSHRLRIEDAFGLASAFTGLAAVAVEDGEHGRAARLLGVVDAIRDRTDAELEPVDVDLYERTATAARSKLTDEGFARSREEGRNLGLEEAAALVLPEGENG